MRSRILLARFAGARRPSGVPGDPGDIDPDAIIIATNGSDSTGTGTLANPLASLPAARALVGSTPGSTIYLRGGVYDVVSGTGQNCYHTESLTTADMRFEGTAENPITISSYPGEWAIFDGHNHPWHPRSLNDGNSPDFGAILLTLHGEHLIIENMEFRNSAARGTMWMGRNITFRNLISHHHHSDGFYMRTHNSLMEFCDAYANYSISNGGNSSDGVKCFYSDALWARYGVNAGGNTWRDCRFWHNGDDGLDTWNTPNNHIERVYSFHNGYGPSTSGRSFKIGGATVTASSGGGPYSFANINTLVKDCVAVGGSGGFTTNDSTGVTLENFTSYKAGVIWMRSQYWTGEADGQNFASNCIAFEGTAEYDVVANSYIVYSNNSGRMFNGGAWNAGIPLAVAGDFLSLDPVSADYLALSTGSEMRGIGVSGVDLGAFQFGLKFTRTSEMAETLPFWV